MADNKYTKQEILDKLPILAEKSPCNKRKVAAIVCKRIGQYFAILGEGFNYNPTGNACEINGETVPEVIHAEDKALQEYYDAKLYISNDSHIVIFVTHPPCKNCTTLINNAGITEIIVAETFLKFDTSKTRFDLVPTTLIKSVAEVLTYGAKKYKPNNWQKVDDHSRYVAALYRHLEAWRAGEDNDAESGLSHLAHAATNISFLIHLKAQGNKNN